MKKLILLFVILLTTMCAFAEEGYGTCKISGTSDYLEGTAYLKLSNNQINGNLVISNGCGRPLQSASISVVVAYRWKTKHTSPYDGGIVVNTFNKKITLYNSRWTGHIAGYQSSQIELRGDISVPSDGYDVTITSIDVSINNPYCE